LALNTKIPYFKINKNDFIEISQRTTVNCFINDLIMSVTTTLLNNVRASFPQKENGVTLELAPMEHLWDQQK
jgi:hypothetical protein